MQVCFIRVAERRDRRFLRPRAPHWCGAEEQGGASGGFGQHAEEVDRAGQVGEAAGNACLALDAVADLPAVPDPDGGPDRILKALTLSAELTDTVGEVAAVAAVEEVADPLGLAVCRPGDGREGRVPGIGHGRASAPHRSGEAPAGQPTPAPAI
jgi:hypothetical protein